MINKTKQSTADNSQWVSSRQLHLARARILGLAVSEYLQMQVFLLQVLQAGLLLRLEFIKDGF